MKVFAKNHFRFSNTGATVDDYAEGAEHEVTRECAMYALQHCGATPVDEDAKALVVPQAPVLQAPRNKSRGSAPENK